MPNRPKPTALKLIQGNPGKRPINKREPKPAADLAAELPRGRLSPGAKRYWKTIAPELARLGLLTDLDRDALIIYCQQADIRDQALALVAGDGLIIETPKGAMIQHPGIGIANRAADMMRSLMIEFGMTPAARAKLQIGEPEADPFAEFLQRRTG